MEINELLEHAVEAVASDVFIVAGLPLSYKLTALWCMTTQIGLCQTIPKRS